MSSWIVLAQLLERMIEATWKTTPSMGQWKVNADVTFKDCQSTVTMVAREYKGRIKISCFSHLFL